MSQLNRAPHGAQRRFPAAAFGAAALGLAAAAAHGQTTVVQNSTISQSGTDFVKWEAEAFHQSAGPDADVWHVASHPNYSGGRIVVAPASNDTAAGTSDVLTYRITFNDPAAAGNYHLYALRADNTFGDSIFPPPTFNADPQQVGTNNNRWNGIPGNPVTGGTGWAEMGVDGDFPDTAYFGTGARNYAAPAGPVTVEFRIENREQNAHFDQFVLHKTAGLSDAALSALAFSPTTVNNPVQAPQIRTAPASGAGPHPRGGAGVWGIREVTLNGTPRSIADAEASINTIGAGARVVDYEAPVVNLYDSDVGGNFPGDSRYRSDPDQTTPDSNTVDNVVVLATGRIRIPATDAYTFAIRSDDGYRLTIGGQLIATAAGQGGTQVVNGSGEFPTGRGAGENSFHVAYLPAGDHDIQLLNWEGDGGASLEIASARGVQTGFNNSFNLIGAPAVAEQTAQRQRFTGTVPANGITVVRYNNLPTSGTGSTAAERLDSVFGRLQQFRAGTGGTPDAQGTFSILNFHDPQNSGARTGGGRPDPVAPPGDTGGDDNDYGLGAFGTLQIPANRTGRYTFDVLADDDSIFRIFGPNGQLVPLVSTNRTGVDTNGDTVLDAHRFNGCCADSFGRYDLTTAGTYTFELAMQEGGGGSFFQLFGAIGDWNEFGDWFQLVGQNLDDSVNVVTVAGRPAGLQLVAVPEPGALTLLGGLAGAGLLSRRRRPRAGRSA